MEKQEILKLIEKANIELEKVKNYMLSIQGKILTPVNLKLYDAFYKACDENRVNDFYDFCDFQFETFKEMIEEETGEKFFNIVHYIGRTSSFYCASRRYYEDIITDNHNNIIFPDTFYNFILDIQGVEDEIANFDNDGLINPDNLFDYIEKTKEYYELSFDDIKNDLDYIISGNFLNNIKDFFKDGLFVYDLLQDFKNDQVTLFDEFLEQIEINEEIEKDTTIENLISALNNFKDKPENIENLKSYLTHCYKGFIEKYANTPENFISELLHFSEM